MVVGEPALQYSITPPVGSVERCLAREADAVGTGGRSIFVGRGLPMFYRVREGSTEVTLPDLVRPIDAPSRGCEYRSTDFLAVRIGCEGRVILPSRTECPRLGTGFGVAKTLDRVHPRLR